MMQFLPQGYSFQSYSNPYQSQFVSPFYGSGQYGWQYSPMAQYGPRLSHCTPGSCPPWLPPGIVATPASGVQELSLLMDPSLPARMSRAYNAWTIGVWGKPDIPAWLWPDGSWPQPVPPNVSCDVPPAGYGPPGPGGYGSGYEPPVPGGYGSGYEPPGYLPPGSSPPPIAKYAPGIPKAGFKPPMSRPAPVPATPKFGGPTLGSFPSGKSTPSPNPRRLVRSRRVNPGETPPCYQAGDKGACYVCCHQNTDSKSTLMNCLNGCVSLPPPKPASSIFTRATRRQRLANQDVRRASRLSRAERRATRTGGWQSLGVRGWCGPGESLCTKKTPSGKSNFCCCKTGSSDCAGGKSTLAYYERP